MEEIMEEGMGGKRKLKGYNRLLYHERDGEEGKRKVKKCGKPRSWRRW